MIFRIKKGDTVFVTSGKEKRREGKVLKVYPRWGRALVEGINLRKRHRRARRAGEKGSTVSVPAPLPLSRLMPKCSHCGRAARIGSKISSGGKLRGCRKCGGEF